MNRSKAIRTSLRLANSLLSTGFSSTQSMCSQVTQFSHLSPSLFSSLSHQPCTFHFLNTHQKIFFSSKPNSTIELVLNNEWSDELEHELENLNPIWTHESVIYVLKKLDNDPQKAFDFFNWVSEKNGFRPSLAIYSLVLRIFVHKETMKQFWVTLRKMKEEGFYIDEETYKQFMGFFGSQRWLVMRWL
ncbi:hypothetical protein L1049_027733 [Liquidambar formosana]|uniref:Pentatricopeptide repeat-containing protein n=1 Tax=Liquidambar formosana TaxID=63359 RepID=A0AAP0RJ99_LIQFO